MIIRRATRPRQFAIVDMVLMNDERLSADALGVLLYLLSRPDNWEVQVDQLKNRFGVGRDKMQGIMRMLRDCGYARLEQMKDPDTGRLLGQGYTIHDEASHSAKPAARTEDVVPAESVGATDCDREPAFQALGEDATENRVSRLPENPTAGKPGSILNTESVLRTERDLSPQPPANAGGRDGPSLWDQFATGWRWDELDIPDHARRAFERLDPVDKNLACRYAAKFCAKAKERDHRLPSARNWLVNRGWENLSKADRTSATPSKTVRILAGSPQAAAWAKYEKKPKLLMVELRDANNRIVLGTHRPTEWPPSSNLAATLASGSPAEGTSP